jgi:PAS domain S-box-containing protein
VFIYPPVINKVYLMVLGLNTVGLLYVAAFAFSGVVCVAAIPRARQFDDPDVKRGLVWLLATVAGWAFFKTAFFVLPDPFRRPSYILGLILGFTTVWAWLYFCSAYTGQAYHRSTPLRRLSVGIILFVVSVKLTNPIHGQYFDATAVTTPFSYLAIQHNIFHWIATGLSYVLATVGLFMLFQLYFESDYDTRPLSVLAALIGLPVVVDIVAQFTPLLIEVIYAPIGVAAFAIGVLFVFERQFMAVQYSVLGDGLSIYLDERGCIRDSSDAIEELLPELDGATGRQLSDVVPEVAAAIDSDDKIIEREHLGDLRYYFVSDSTIELGDAGVRVVQLSDVTQTERQRRELAERERELDDQNELFRAVIDASFAFVFRIDRDGQFSFVSPAVEDFLGYSPSELEDQSVTVTLPDESTVERAWTEIESVLDGEANLSRDFPLETKSGTTVYADIRSVPIYDGSVPTDERTPEDIVGIQLMVRDATERRQQEGMISVINRVLRHNLRNKITVITSYAEMLEAKLDGEDATKATHIRRTADRLLDLSESAQRIEKNREHSPELEPIDVLPILDRTVSQLRMRHPDASVTVDAPDTARAQTNERLETALWELLDNAATHGGDSPTVEVAVTVTERQVVVAIEDNGPGLPETEQEVLQSNTETQLVHGDGLGLWLVYWIVTSLNGDVAASVSPDGTTITVRLPRPS